MDFEWQSLFNYYEAGQKEQLIQRVEKITSDLVNEEDTNGDFPLILSCKRGICELADLFIKKGCSSRYSRQQRRLIQSSFVCLRKKLNRISLFTYRQWRSNKPS
jgi:hypothetical protein